MMVVVKDFSGDNCRKWSYGKKYTCCTHSSLFERCLHILLHSFSTALLFLPPSWCQKSIYLSGELSMFHPLSPSWTPSALPSKYGSLQFFLVCGFSLKGIIVSTWSWFQIILSIGIPPCSRQLPETLNSFLGYLFVLVLLYFLSHEALIASNIINLQKKNTLVLLHCIITELLLAKPVLGGY